MITVRTDFKKITQSVLQILKYYNGCLNYCKLIKLVYLCDREAFKLWELPISTDNYVSMDNGPVLSNLYDLILRKKNDEAQQYWNNFITLPENFEIRLRVNDIPYEELSNREIKLIQVIAEKFRKYKWWEMISYCHNPHNIPEWKDPGSTSIPIAIDEIFKALGKNDTEIQKIKEDYDLYFFETDFFMNCK